MKLTDNEKKVLAAVEFQAERPIVELEKTTKLKASAIRYHLANLLQRKVLRFYPFIDIYRIGFFYHKIYYSLTSAGKLLEDELHEFLLSHQRVSYYSAIGGESEYNISLAVRSPFEILEFLNEIGSKFGPILRNVLHVSQATLHYFPAKYLTQVTSEISLSWGGDPAEHSIDQEDIVLLHALVNTEYSSRRELARLLKWSQSKFEYRLKQLKDNKIFKDFIYLHETKNFDVNEYKVLLLLNGCTLEFHQKILKFCMNHPIVTVLIQCVGAWSYEMTIEVEQTHEVQLFVRNLETISRPYYESSKVFSVFALHKLSNFPMSGLGKVGS